MKNFNRMTATTTPAPAATPGAAPANVIDHPHQRCRQGVARNIDPRSDVPVLSQEGLVIAVDCLWHVQISPSLHAYLGRSPNDGTLQLHIRMLKTSYDGTRLFPEKEHGVRLDKQQSRNLMFSLLELRPVILKKDEVQVSVA